MSDPSAVHTGSRWEREPIFHEARTWRGDRPVYLCGRTGSAYDHFMRRDHAQRFGRPCKACLKKGMPWIFRLTTSHQNWRPA